MSMQINKIASLLKNKDLISVENLTLIKGGNSKNTGLSSSKTKITTPVLGKSNTTGFINSVGKVNSSNALGDDKRRP